MASGENSLAARLKRQREERLKEREARAQQESSMSRFFRKVTSAQAGLGVWARELCEQLDFFFMFWRVVYLFFLNICVLARFFFCNFRLVVHFQV